MLEKSAVGAFASLLLASTSALAIPQGESTRFASYNAFLNRSERGALIADLSAPDNEQAQAVAEIIQRTRPDVLLLNEFDYDGGGVAVRLFLENYLNVSQNGADPIDYPYVFLAPSNTGIPSGFDLDNDGTITTKPGSVGYGNDCFGFGFFPGQFAMVVLSRYEILNDEVRTFQRFRWVDMPGALLPDDPATPEPHDFYSPEELQAFRLSSKSHWDVPVMTPEGVVHVLAAHPTPPVFDGPEDRNGLRNHDEIRFWSDYVRPWLSDYIVDDAGESGGLPLFSRFVIMGDYNADPNDGDGVPGAMQQLLDLPRVKDSCASSLGGLEAALRQAGVNVEQAGSPAFDTGDFTDESPNFTPSGNLRVDYVLHSWNLRKIDSGVFWPAEDEPYFELVGPGDPSNGSNVVSSDHRMVWADLKKGFDPGGGEDVKIDGLTFLGEATLPTGFEFEGTEVGGLSALVYQPELGIYLALSDDRGSVNEPRFYTLSLDLDDGSLENGDVALRDVVTLLDGDGMPFEPASIDPEGLAVTKTGLMYLSSEGDANAGLDPFVNRFGVSGAEVESLEVPGKFLVAPGVGIRNNLAFESLTINPKQTMLVTGTENALIQDGPPASVTRQSPCRILTYDLETGEPGAEYIYWTETVAAPSMPPGQFITNGLVELLSLGDERMLAVERSFSVGVGNAIRVYEIDTSDADDVRSVGSLAGVVNLFEPVEKELLIDFDILGITLDNIEGVTFGPVLDDGRQTLVFVSDNNFNPGQFTQFLAFAIEND